MAKKVTQKDRSMSDDVQYGIHLGKKVHQDILRYNTKSINEAAAALDIHTNTLRKKFENAYFGNVYDVVKISLYLGKDYFTDLSIVLRNEGLKSAGVISESDFVATKNQLTQVQEELGRYKRIIDQITKK